MGYGDNLMATGMAKGFAAKGKRVAFGNDQKILWDHHSETIFRNNPNIARPGEEGSPDLEWIRFYRGHRMYNSPANGKWLWNHEFHAQPGEVYFDQAELEWANRLKPDFVLIEPNVPDFKTIAPNKQWPKDRYATIARRLKSDGHRVCQFSYSAGVMFDGVEPIKTPTVRHALAALSKAKLYIGPEGGLHHGAAAVGVRGVVIFGGFIPPEVTGYATHTNIAVGEACGSLSPCPHCKRAMASISTERVYEAANSILEEDQWSTKAKSA